MPQSDPSKTEKPTEKQIKKARDEGNVPRSQELGKLVVLIFGLIVVRILIGYIGDEILAVFSWFLGNGTDFQADPETLNTLFWSISSALARILLPVFFVLALAAFLGTFLQVGKLWSMKVMKPKFGKMFNLANGIKKMAFNTQTAVRLARSVGQAIAVGIAPYIIIREEMNHLLPLFYQDVDGIVVHILSTGFRMVLYALIPMIIIATADTFYTRWDYVENLKMTKDEIKDERKQQEGDEKVKSEQRRKMLAVSQTRMLQNVPKADVIITNPTHYAVALVYNPIQAPAPVVVAKGVDHLAQKIREIAKENDIPIRENKPVARALYDQVEIGDVIPEELYKAVATILAKISKFKRRSQ